jgi:ABC-type branched-subunit amino acid transport system ATPase component
LAGGLAVRGLCVSYGRVAAVNDVSFTVPEASALGIIGANGAGKSSTLKAILRQVVSSSQTLEFDGVSLAATPAHRIVSLGIGYVPEGRRIFPGLSVRKNLLMGAYRQNWRRLTDRIDRVYDHYAINHTHRVYVDGHVHTQTIEGFFSLVKNGIRGVYHVVSAKWLQGYLNEYAWRYNHRDDEQAMFKTLLLRATI